MSNSSGPEQPKDVGDEVAEHADGHAGEYAEHADDPPAAENVEPDADHVDGEAETEAVHVDPEHEPATEVFAPADPAPEPAVSLQSGERRFTAPSGFDAGSTEKIDMPADPATEVMATAQPKPAAPQMIPPRGEVPQPAPNHRSWGWVVALLLVIAALVAVAVLGTVLLTRSGSPKVSQEDMVRSTIEEFDAAIQSGDLATLRSITCGGARDSYVNYDDNAWEEIHNQVSAAKQYPVVASIDEIVINDDHAEANVTTFMAYAPQTRSTRSFDLQFRDDQWKICQAPQ